MVLLSYPLARTAELCIFGGVVFDAVAPRHLSCKGAELSFLDLEGTAFTSEQLPELEQAVNENVRAGLVSETTVTGTCRKCCVHPPAGSASASVFGSACVYTHCVCLCRVCVCVSLSRSLALSLFLFCVDRLSTLLHHILDIRNRHYIGTYSNIRRRENVDIT